MKTPLIHIISNNVTKQWLADGVLIYGGSPIMSEHFPEFNDLHRHTQCLVINLGTLTESKKKCIYMACESANKNKIPIGIDPVGIHMSKERLVLFQTLLQTFDIAFVRGNSDEVVSAFNPDKALSMSLEATSVFKATHLKNKLRSHHSIWLVSGETDYILGQNKYLEVVGGKSVLRKVSGAGCLLTALVAVNVGYGMSTFKAAELASKNLKRASEIAYEASRGKLGQFKISLLDALEMERK